LADKFIRNNAGTLTETEATVVSTGASEAGDIVALDASGKIDESVLPTGIGADVGIIEASETLAAGDFVSVWDDAGTTKVRKADASTTGKDAHGFVLDAVTSGQNATVYFEGINNQLTGLTGGVTYFLSESTAGDVVSTAPTGAGEIVQRIGRSFSSTELTFEYAQPIVLV
jgi:hypothetical protein